ncbi:MAG: hypothetical protein KF883_00150 [Thermomicrobiales bacterium]|nr:hypothetical protein [Thermomicrobiales bacterium]
MQIDLIECRSFDGPTVWSLKPSTRMLVASRSAGASELPSSPVQPESLTDLYDALARSSTRRPRLDPLPATDSRAPALIGTLGVNLQRLAGIGVRETNAWPVPETDVWAVGIEHTHPAIGKASAEMAVSLANGLLSGDESFPATAAEQYQVVLRCISNHSSFWTVQPLLEVAAARGIPVTRVDSRGRMIELGNGSVRWRAISTSTSMMSAFAEEISHDKLVTSNYLRAAGLPVPDGGAAPDVDHAARIAARIGYPVVLKPVRSGGAVGVVLDLRDEDELRRAFPAAAAAIPSSLLLVERYLAGRDYRVTVVNNAISSVLETEAASVTGDGLHTIERLVEIENRNPARGYRDTDTCRPITIDSSVETWLVQRRGLTLQHVPAPGEIVRLRLWPDMGNGGRSIDWTDDIHPDNRAIILQAAGIVGLDIATLDIVSPDMTRSIWETGGAILDVNAHSGFRMQRFPTVGKGRDPFPAIIDMLFPPGAPVRVPIVAAIGHDAGAMCEAIARTLGQTGRCVGLATDARLAVGGMELKGVKRSGAAGIRTILNNPAVEIAVAEVTAQGIVDEGLGFGNCDAVALLSTSGHLTPFGQPVEAVLTRLVEPGGVIAFAPDDPVARNLGASAPARSLPIEPGGAGLWLDHVIELVTTLD